MNIFMRAKFLAIFLCALAPAAFADFSAGELREVSAQTVDALEASAKMEAAWFSEKEAALSRLAALEALNARLEAQIAEEQARESAAKKASAEMLETLAKYAEFEKNLAEILGRRGAEFAAKASKEPAKSVLNFSGKGGEFADVYARAAAAINERIYALEASKNLSVQNAGGEKALAIGLCAMVKKSDCAGLDEVFEMLDGRAAYKILSLKIKGAKK